MSSGGVVLNRLQHETLAPHVDAVRLVHEMHFAFAQQAGPIFESIAVRHAVVDGEKLFADAGRHDGATARLRAPLPRGLAAAAPPLAQSPASGSLSGAVDADGYFDRTGSISVLIWFRVSGPRRYDIAHRVSKHDRLVVVHVVHQEHAVAERGERGFHLAGD